MWSAQVILDAAHRLMQRYAEAGTLDPFSLAVGDQVIVDLVNELLDQAADSQSVPSEH